MLWVHQFHLLKGETEIQLSMSPCDGSQWKGRGGEKRVRGGEEKGGKG